MTLFSPLIVAGAHATIAVGRVATVHRKKAQRFISYSEDSVSDVNKTCIQV
jgi:hypothetical protein